MTNNEPAFPVDGGYHEELESIEGVMHVRGSAKPAHTGLTKREWFAGMALMGMNANPELLECMTKTSIVHGSHFEALAKNAYKQADAMLKATKE